ncbi:MAG TPA: DUF4232 domain-containing protein [Acidimicrobiales bacterium]|nr:DUF4232 domain-containing protein [Acidimicrobiales bacterium]
MRNEAPSPIRPGQRRAVAPAALMACGLVLAACGVVGPTHPQPSATTALPPGGGVSSSAPTTAPLPSAAPPSAPGATHPSRCHTAQLSAQVVRRGAATGHVGQTIALRNVSSLACTLYGYPGLLMLDAADRPLMTRVNRGTSYVVHAQTPATVTLAPGGAASFALGYRNATGYPGSRCPTSARLEVTPPNATHHLVIPDRLSPYGPCGRITVSPVYPGTGPQP